MGSVELQRIGSFARVVGFWQFSVSGEHHLMILEVARRKSTLSVKRLQGGRWAGVRKIKNEDVRIRAADGHLIGSEVFICTELNGMGWEAMRLVSSEARALVGPDAGRVPFRSLGKLGLAAEQLESIDLPGSRWWNVAGPLAPRAWLFGPKFVKGEVSTPQVVVSTADGQVAALGLAGQGQLSELLGVRRALDPQAIVSGGIRYVAFKRIDGDVYPFWVLPRYSGHRDVINGELVVGTGAGHEVNLSAELDIGPVMKHALTLDRDGRVWLFALQDAPVGRDVLAIEQADGEWLLREKLSVDLEIDELSVAPGQAGWHVVYGVGDDDAWKLYYQAWQ